LQSAKIQAPHWWGKYLVRLDVERGLSIARVR